MKIIFFLSITIIAVISFDCSTLVNNAKDYIIESKKLAKDQNKEQYKTEISHLSLGDLQKCLNSIKKDIEDDLNGMKTIYWKLKYEDDLIDKEKDKILNAIDDKRKDLQEKFKNNDITEIQNELVKTSRECHLREIEAVKKINKKLKKASDADVNDLKEKTEVLKKENKKVEDLIDDFQKKAQKCIKDKDESITEYKGKFDKINDEIGEIEVLITEADKKKENHLKDASIICLDHIKQFVVDMSEMFQEKVRRKKVVKRRGKLFNDEEERMRFSKDYPSKTPPISLAKYFKLYLLGKMLNVELKYKEVLEPLKNQKKIVEEFLKEKEKEDKEEADKSDIDKKALEDYEKLAGGFKKDAEDLEDEIKKIQAEKAKIKEDIEKIRKDNNALLAQKDESSKKSKKECEELEKKMIELNKKLKELQDSLENINKKLQIARDNAKLQADNLEKLTLEFKTNFLPALNNLVAYLKKVVVSVENSYKEAKKDEIFENRQIRGDKDVIESSIKECIPYLLETEQKKLNEVIEDTTYYHLPRDWVKDLLKGH